MQKNVVETILGAVVLIVAIGFMFFFKSVVNIEPARGYTVTASFTDASGLQKGTPIMLSGIKVGQVAGFELDTDTYDAIITMTIRPDVKLPLDTAAIIASAGLLDGKFMSLEPGGDEEMLQDGDTIEYTQSAPSLEKLLGQVVFSLTDKGEDKGTE